MTFQAVHVTKFLGAVEAEIWHFPGVNSVMNGEGSKLTELSRAHVAFVRFFSCVNLKSSQIVLASRKSLGGATGLSIFM